MGDVGRLVGGRYRIDRELERGPGTQTLLVTDLRNGRPCVLRLLSVAAATPADAQRFESQAAILAKLNHPGLPRFIDGFSEGEGGAAERVVVTSYHPGESLERLVVKGRPLTESQALVLLRRLVPVLVFLHAFEPPLVHRTISATGIIIGPDGRPCLTDLDYAVAGLAAPSPQQVPPGPDELALAAPEVYMGGAIPASDIYALGLAVCRGMTAKDPVLLLREGAKMPLRAALGVSEAFAAVLARMLEVSLERRYTDARVLDADLAKLAGVRVAPERQPAARPVEAPRAAEETRPRRGARWPILAGVALALIVLAVVAVVAVRRRNLPVPETSLLVVPEPREQPAAPAAPGGGGTASAPSGEPAAPPEAPAVALSPAVAPGLEPASVPGSGPSSQSAVQPAPTPPAPAEPAPNPALSTAAPAEPAVPTPPAAPAPAAVEGRLLFDGKPFTDSRAPAPLFWFRNEGMKNEAKPQVEYASGTFTVRGLSPGRYGMSVRIDLEPDNPNIFPGDLNAWSEFTLEAGRPIVLEVSLRTVMHLIQPVDNGVVIRGWDTPCGAGNPHPGKLVFSWDELAPGTRYDVSVDRLLCGRGYAVAGRVFTHSTTEAWVKVDLPPNQEGECYSFRLAAIRGGRMVGILSTHGKTGLGWDYRFTVAGLR